LKAFVVIATKGRAKETFILLDYLAVQTYPFEKVIVVGSEESDVENLSNHALFTDGKCLIQLSKPGLTIQRNAGLEMLLPYVITDKSKDWFIVFFDDDFRPANNWLEKCADTFKQDEHLAGISGWVLADGVTTKTITETEAQAYLNGETSPFTPSWQGYIDSPYGLYGCNMAFRGIVAKTERFDENLPLYGWQEDLDYGARATKFGKLVKVSDCIGVHLGVSGGRTSGVRFGYSQIANPIYLIKKGTMNKTYGSILMRRNFMSNVFHTIIFDRKKDYFGRLCGNFIAFYHIIISKNHPTKVLEI